MQNHAARNSLVLRNLSITLQWSFHWPLLYIIILMCFICLQTAAVYAFHIFFLIWITDRDWMKRMKDWPVWWCRGGGTLWNFPCQQLGDKMWEPPPVQSSTGTWNIIKSGKFLWEWDCWRENHSNSKYLNVPIIWPPVAQIYLILKMIGTL